MYNQRINRLRPWTESVAAKCTSTECLSFSDPLSLRFEPLHSLSAPRRNGKCIETPSAVPLHRAQCIESVNQYISRTESLRKCGERERTRFLEEECRRRGIVSIGINGDCIAIAHRHGQSAVIEIESSFKLQRERERIQSAVRVQSEWK